MMQAAFNIRLLTENIIFTAFRFLLVYDLMRYFMIDRK